MTINMINAYETRADEIELLNYHGRALAVLRDTGDMLCACGAVLTVAEIMAEPTTQAALAEVGQAMRVNAETGETGLVPILGWVCPECVTTIMMLTAMGLVNPVTGDLMADGR